jgi:hypothetical protein
MDMTVEKLRMALEGVPDGTRVVVRHLQSDKREWAVHDAYHDEEGDQDGDPSVFAIDAVLT